jgi:hypothetical protein
MDGRSIEYTDTCLTFMDIQGFTDLVLKRYPDKPETIYEVLKQFKRVQYYEPSDFSLKWEPEIVNFSDSIVRVIFCKESDYSDGEILANEIKALRLMQQQLFIWPQDLPDKWGIFLRGGLTTGPAFIDRSENMVFGPAMIQAHSLEDIKNTPFRIVVDRATLDAHPKALETLAKIRAIAEDDDGSWFIDYFSVNQFRRYGFWSELERLRKVKDILQAQLSLNQENEKLLLKYLWAAKKHNAAIRASKQLDDALKNEGFELDQLVVQIIT